jgi:Ca2+/Na+ antiporter
VTPLLGSSLFITSAVIPLALRAAESGAIHVTPSFFIRDIFFFVLVYIYLVVILFAVGHFNFYISLGFLAIYIIYVALVVIQARQTKDESEENIHDAHLAVDAEDFLKAGARARAATGGAKHTGLKAVEAEFKRMAAKRGAGLDIDDESDSGLHIEDLGSDDEGYVEKKIAVHNI